jgi:hypothetical protein
VSLHAVIAPANAGGDPADRAAPAEIANALAAPTIAAAPAHPQPLRTTTSSCGTSRRGVRALRTPHPGSEG